MSPFRHARSRAEGSGLQTWLTIAEEAEGKAATAKHGNRNRIYAEIAALHGLTPATVQRQIISRRFVLIEAPAVGVEIDEVVASLSTVEALKRLSKLSVDHAQQFTRMVLKGQMTRGSLVSLIETLELMARDDESDLEGQFVARRQEIAKTLLRRVRRDAALVAVTGEIVEFLRLDIAMQRQADEGLALAAIFSPTWPFARLAQQTVEDALRALFAAAVFFEQVFFVTDDPSERARFHTMMHFPTASTASIELVFATPATLS